MVDEIYDRMYQSGRAQLHGSLDHLFASIANGFKALHEVQWSAPWAAKPTAASKDAGCA